LELLYQLGLQNDAIVPFSFSSIDSRLSLFTPNTLVDSVGVVTYNLKDIPSDELLSTNTIINTIDNLNNSNGNYLVISSIYYTSVLNPITGSHLVLTYDSTLCPEVTSIIIDDDGITATSTVPITKYTVSITLNVNRCSITIPSIYFEYTYPTSNTVRLTPFLSLTQSQTTMIKLIGPGQIMDASFLILGLTRN
jgi:hypothetical protein